ncbi:MAG: glycoside hydrolase family 9 protein [Longimicrobiales bacterium]
MRGRSTRDDIRLNQIGFYPFAPKQAFIVGVPSAETFYVLDVAGDTVYSALLGAWRSTELSSDSTRLADFSALSNTGRYVLRVPGLGDSHPFEIRPRAHELMARAALKGFYYQRASTALESRFAGEWARDAGHPDTSVLVHASAATAERPVGTRVSSPGGWYDAGDYNKYIVNSGITVATLLSLYEDFPEQVAALDVDIPESGDALPDLLDETLWNVRWMLAMQDPDDGGVYHKLTAANFEGFLMPAQARAQRYVVQKSTAATLDFAAAMAQASRVLRRLAQEPPDRAEPGRAGEVRTSATPQHDVLGPLADSTLAAARLAWSWARQHADVAYDQRRLNETFDPDIETGTYGARELDDERIWAAVELFLTTREDSFYTAVPLFPDSAAPLPSWSQVRTLAYYSLARFRHALPPPANGDAQRVRDRLIASADSLVRRATRSAYATPMGGSPDDFIWGSSAVAANQGIALITAYRLTGDRTYLLAALANLDYLLGRNATGYSFVTGYGGKTPRHPHHRPSEADGVEAPVPGLLVGGPNAGRQDGCDYPFTEPDRSYVDHVCSYASNEIAINWNAPLVYLASALEALQFEAGFSVTP